MWGEIGKCQDWSDLVMILGNSFIKWRAPSMDFSPSWQDGGGAPWKEPRKAPLSSKCHNQCRFPSGFPPSAPADLVTGALGALQDAVLKEATN